MTDKQLSPAAQAVLDAVALSMEGGWISPDFIPYEAHKAAAALRAAAEEVVLPKYQYANWEMAHLIMQEIQAIAAELEGK